MRRTHLKYLGILNADGLALRQIFFHALVLGILAVLACQAAWKDRTWQRTTGTVVAATEMCTYYRYYHGDFLFVATMLGYLGQTVRCDNVAKNLELRRTWNVGSHAGFRHGYMDAYWLTKIAYEDAKGNGRTSTIKITDFQVHGPAPSLQALSRDRHAIGLWSNIVVPGDRYELAYGNWLPGQADLAANLPQRRTIWGWVLIVAAVVTAFSFGLRLLPESEEEHNERPKYNGFNPLDLI